MKSFEKVPSSPPPVILSYRLTVLPSYSPAFLLFSFFIFFMSLSSHAQDRCPYQGPQQPASIYSTTVGNFTITDTEGNVYDLYETLDSGKTVFIDLFFTRCTFCQQYAGIIEQIYQDNGAGEEDILMWGISQDSYDTNHHIVQYKADYGITNPCAGWQGGGVSAHNTIISGQNFLGWPTYCVICPDRTMFFDPVYPPTVTGFNPYFAQCNSTVGVDEKDYPKNTGIVSVYPNPANDILSVEMDLNGNSHILLEVFDLAGSAVLRSEYRKPSGHHSLTLDLSSLPGGCYFLKMSQDGTFIEARSLVVY